jgi:methanol metabolism-related c-type cytochrome
VPRPGRSRLVLRPSKDTATEGNEATEGDLGKYADPSGNPTYLVDAAGKVDWYTWRGYKKYMANCMQCHGPDGLGSSFAPNLTDQLQQLSYYDFAGIVVSGQQNKWSASGNSIMPAWGEDPNVMCSMDAIYIYLRARADGVVGRGEPKRIANNKAAQDEEYSCLGF